MKRLLLSSAIVLAAACSDDEAASSSGVDGSKQITALSAAEKRNVCRWATDLGRMTVRESCIPEAIFYGDTKAECEQSYNECAQGEAERIESEYLHDLENCDGEIEITEGCTATVATYEMCLRERVNGYRAALAPLTCDKPMPGWEGPDINPPSCAGDTLSCFP